MTICKGTNAVLSGSCSSATDSFHWSTPGLNTNNSISSLSSSSTQVVSNSGTYTAYCVSVHGCVSALSSITINQGVSCGGNSFITVTPELPAICPGASVLLTATGCTGTVTWSSTGFSVNGSSATLTPATTTTYAVSCSTGGSTSVEVQVAVANVNIAGNITTGKSHVKAVNTIESDKRVGSPNFTPAPNVLYEAGNSILLNPGFVAEGTAIFKAEIKVCN